MYILNKVTEEETDDYQRYPLVHILNPTLKLVKGRSKTSKFQTILRTK